MQNQQDINSNHPLSVINGQLIRLPLFSESPLSSSPCHPLSLFPYFIPIQGKIREYKERRAVRLLREPGKNKN
jgi:hypothetical protein